MSVEMSGGVESQRGQGGSSGRYCVRRDRGKEEEDKERRRRRLGRKKMS